ncbi:MAG: DUF1289 domain-containing protein [Azospirillaceae bacterium]
MSASPRLPSPCIGLCRLDEAGRECVGCLRTLDEIGAWPTADDATRAAILERLKERRKAAGRSGGRADSPRRRRVATGP